MKYINLLLIVSTVFMLAGCDKIIDEKVSKKVEEAEEQNIKNVNDLNIKIIELERRIIVNEILNKVLADKIDKTFDFQALVSTEGQGYGIARTKHGPFLINVEKVEPYMDGVKLKVSIGNITNATFSGADIVAKWGREYKNGDDFDEWEKAQKEKKITTPVTFFPGSYASVNLILTPAKSDEIKTIKIGIQFDRLSLRNINNN